MGKLLHSLKEAFGKSAKALVVPAVAAAACAAMVVSVATGNASAAVGNETAVAYYGLSVVDWFLVGIGAIGFVIGCYLRDLRVIGIGTILLVLGGVANYLGV